MNKNLGGPTHYFPSSGLIDSLEGESWEWCKDNFKLMTMEEFNNQGGFKPHDVLFWSNHVIPNENLFLRTPESKIGHYYLMTDFEPSNTFTNYDYSVYDIRFTPSAQDPLVKTLEVEPGHREANFTWNEFLIQRNCYIFKGAGRPFYLFQQYLNWEHNPLEGK